MSKANFGQELACMSVATEAILIITAAYLVVWATNTRWRHSKGKSKTEGPHSKPVALQILFADLLGWDVASRLVVVLTTGYCGLGVADQNGKQYPVAWRNDVLSLAMGWIDRNCMPVVAVTLTKFTGEPNTTCTSTPTVVYRIQCGKP